MLSAVCLAATAFTEDIPLCFTIILLL